MKIALMMLVGLTVTGCSLSNEQFDCKYDKGVGCKSITEVNKMVDSGAFGSNQPASITVVTKNQKNSNAMVVERVTEQHLRIWLAPMIDEQGQLHEGQLIHTVLRPGFWFIKEEV